MSTTVQNIVISGTTPAPAPAVYAYFPAETSFYSSPVQGVCASDGRPFFEGDFITVRGNSFSMEEHFSVPCSAAKTSGLLTVNGASASRYEYKETNCCEIVISVVTLSRKESFRQKGERFVCRSSGVLPLTCSAGKVRVLRL